MKIRNFMLKGLLFVMSALILFTGCSRGDTVETTDTSVIVESLAETTKSQAPSETADRDYIKFKNPWKTGIEAETSDGKKITLRTVEIDIAGDGAPIEIFQITDVHFNAYYNDEHSTVKASYNEWGDIVENSDDIIANYKRCINYAANADRIVITGDIMNFYSRANCDLVEKYVFNAKANINSAMKAKIIAVCGNHDAMLPGANNKKEIHESNQEKVEALYKKYGQELKYYREVIDERVMLIQMDNAMTNDIASAHFTNEQAALLETDIQTARAKGYTVLLFYHIPLPSNNPEDIMQNYDGGMYKYSDADKKVYKTITNNADVIKGCFAGHTHADSYSEIVAKTSDGKKAFVPQYVLKALYLENGAMTKITLK
jgi:predicted MPP superfamily phosphohydrolase